MTSLIRMLAEQVLDELEVEVNGTAQHVDASENPDPCPNPCTDSEPERRTP
jgi:hypothetical protein